MKRRLSGILSLVMCLQIFTSNTFAIEKLFGNSKQIIAVADLPSNIATQEITLNTDLDPILPEELTATILSQKSDGTQSTIESNAAVSWELPKGKRFSTENEETLTYTPKLKNGTYTITKDVELPTITVKILLPENVLQSSSAKLAGEQFSLIPGGIYYFDLSSELNNIDAAYKNLPDKTLHYVPFTYAGGVEAYDLEPSDQGAPTTEARANALKGKRSLFVAKMPVLQDISWNMINENSLIYGKPFNSNYILRSMSGGSTIFPDALAPTSNEYRQIVSKILSI